jgi:hypothetical protein
VFSFTVLYPFIRYALSNPKRYPLGHKIRRFWGKILLTTGVNLRSKKQAMTFLVEDLRIEKDRLRELNLREMVKWLPACPKRPSIKNVIEAIAEL